MEPESYRMCNTQLNLIFTESNPFSMKVGYIEHLYSHLYWTEYESQIKEQWPK